MKFSLENFLLSGTIMSLSKDKVLIGWGKSEQLSSKGLNPRKPSFYLNDFFRKKRNPWIQHEYSTEMDIDQFLKMLTPAETSSVLEWRIEEEDKFKELFNALKEEIKQKKLKKGVPYLFAYTSECMTMERLQNSLYHAIHSLSKSKGYLYGHWKGKEGILGVTPELLFTRDKEHPQVVKTVALAGTCRPDEDVEAFFEDEKERHEHQLVVEGISIELRKLGRVKLGELKLLKLPRLTHLLTPIELELSSTFNFNSMVNALHPTPALGVFPKKEGKEWLAECDNQIPRKYFGAPIGFICPKEGLFTCFVAIRNVQWNGSGLKIGAGCGVVHQSIYEEEVEEIHAKMNAIRSQLNL